MRKLVFMMSVSLDGFFEAEDGGLGWQRVDEELHQHFNDWLGRAGGFLDGRVTYEQMAAFWPTADANPANSQQMRDFAGIWRDMPKIVYSRTLGQASWNTTIVRDVVPEEVLALKAQPGGDLVLGGADLAATFMEHDLIDEYRLYMQPILLGAGHLTFRPPAGRVGRLDLAETRPFGSGVVLLRYERTRLA
jgi:dihydrofolate reductase